MLLENARGGGAMKECFTGRGNSCLHMDIGTLDFGSFDAIHVPDIGPLL